MAEHGVPDARRNKNRLAGTSHTLPAGYKPQPDPRRRRQLQAAATASPTTPPAIAPPTKRSKTSF